MEPVDVHITKIEDLLFQMDDILGGARSAPFSNKVQIDRDAFYAIIDDIRPILKDIAVDLPNEINQAKRVIFDGDKIINDARSKAAMIIKSAEAEVAKMTSDSEIMKLATKEAEQITEDGKRSARELRLTAMEYVDEILQKTEDVIRTAMESYTRRSREVDEFFADTIDTIYDNRQQLRGGKN